MRPGDSFSNEAIVLKVQPYEETHSLVKLLLPNHGKLSCFARGAQRSRKRFGALLQPGMQVKAYLKSPRSELNPHFFNLELLESLDRSTIWQGDFQSLQSLMFSLSLSNAALPDGPVDERIYRNLQSYISSISSIDGKQAHMWLRMLFWLNFSFLLGHTISLSSVNQKLKTLHELGREILSGVEGAEYSFLSELKELPELSMGDFKVVSNEWRRVSENDWNFSKVLY